LLCKRRWFSRFPCGRDKKYKDLANFSENSYYSNSKAASYFLFQLSLSVIGRFSLVSLKFDAGKSTQMYTGQDGQDEVREETRMLGNRGQWL
jgi:hypothetical protein